SKTRRCSSTPSRTRTTGRAPPGEPRSEGSITRLRPPPPFVSCAYSLHPQCSAMLVRYVEERGITLCVTLEDLVELMGRCSHQHRALGLEPCFEFRELEDLGNILADFGDDCLRHARRCQDAEPRIILELGYPRLLEGWNIGKDA